MSNEKTKRELELEDLLRSACAIAEREGRDTAWKRFADRIKSFGINGITAKVFKILRVTRRNKNGNKENVERV